MRGATGFSRFRWLMIVPVTALAVAVASVATPATSIDELVAAVVRIKTYINPDGRTVESLGREREGSGVLIDEDGLVLTIGYLMVEAMAAEVVTNTGRTVPANVVGYDNETGFGLLKTIEPLKIKPLALGKSAEVKERDPMLVASYGGVRMVAPVHVAATREFAGNWEYLIDNAIFTTPPHPAWSGSALINRDGKLVGIGSLIVGDANGKEDGTPGNMLCRSMRCFPSLPTSWRMDHLRCRPAVARHHRERDAWTSAGRPRRAGKPGRESGVAAATSSPALTEKCRALSPTSTARFGRRGRRAPWCRSISFIAARSGGSR